MKMRFALAAVPVALLSLSACSSIYDYGYDDYGYSDYGYGSYGYNDGYGYNDYRPGVSVGLVYHDAWYDNFYGPVYGGYWAPDGYFWYQNRIGGSYYQDYSRHFRRDQYRGYSKYRYQDNRGHGGRDANTYPPLFKGQDRDRDRDRGRDDDRNDRNGRDNRNGGREWNNNDRNAPPRANPPPSPQWNGGRGDADRGGARNNDRGADRGGNDRGERGNGAPPLFASQPRVNPPPSVPRGGGLDGAPRSGRNDADRQREPDRGGPGRGGREGAAPPPPQSQPAPGPRPPSLWSKPSEDTDRGGRKEGAGNRGGGDRSEDNGKRGKYGKRPD